ncbi:MAG: phenylalanyl-tRNA synthetase beta chain [Acidobacteriota bacterium]|jgi:phenylalanyl-tRNA synthetase beta chain|nr:phenylalanyl-tRNA synthetase beta chain [Acidobacteriota bacterium]
MEFSCEWLAQYVDLPADPQELAGRLTAAGLAVEGISAHGDDTGLDVDVTTNRPDCMNHFGLAREIAVLREVPLRRPPAAPPEGTERVEDAARVVIEDLEGCPRCTARVVRGVTIGPSPEWLRRRLESIGQRPINNVVDVTNFVLWELGQPLHAYDLAKLAGSRIVVRRARAGETALKTLDGQDRALDPETLVIADAERPVGLAGVMGGLESEVTDATRDILIESAHFDRRRVRTTAKRLGMHTDASHRFERGSDPEICAEAASRAAALIAEIAGGTVLAGVLDVRDLGRSWHRRGRLDLPKLDAFAGVAIDPADAERWLRGLGFGVVPFGDEVWGITVPSWRYFDFQPRPEPPHDVYPQDVYEEVLRVFGLDRIPAALPAIPGADAPRAENLIRRDRVRRQLAASGYTEAVHFAFLDPARDAAFPSLRPEAKAIRLANPISEQLSVLRRSLVPNLVETARFNQRRGLPAVRMFEIANVFYERPEGGIPEQPEHVGLVCGGRVGTPWEREVELDLFDLKGVIEALADAFGVRLEARPSDLPGVLAGNSAELLRGGEVVGWFGRVAEEEEGYPLYAAEVATTSLAGGDVSLQVELPSRFPGITADFTLTQRLEVPWVEVQRAIEELAPPDLVSWRLKDRYRGPGVPEGAVNTTLSFHYNARERSLTQEEVNARQLALSQELERRFGWKG